MSRPFEARTQIVYESPDLELFEKATNWKTYWSSKLHSFINGRVIEVGAGLGSSTVYMCRKNHIEWVCLDPDPLHVARLTERIVGGRLPTFCRAECGVLSDLPLDLCADAILYIDVLEHIEDDEAEMQIASSRLKTGGYVVVVSPAFNWLYSPFDRAVGHYRRYIKADAYRLSVPGLKLRKTFYLDSVGFFLSLLNRVLLQASMPSAQQIRFWDKRIIPISLYADKLLGTAFGRTIVMVWEKS